MRRLARQLAAPFRLQGRMDRRGYALAVAVVLFLEIVVMLAAQGLQGLPLIFDLQMLVIPFHNFHSQGGAGDITIVPHNPELFGSPKFLVQLLLLWRLAVVSFRRAADAGITGFTAALMLAPLLQLPALLVLLAWPPRTDVDPARDAGSARPSGWACAAQAMIAGMVFTVFAVTVGALVFRLYGWGLFVLTPILIGVIAGYLVNRDGDVGGEQTAFIASAAILLGGIALLATALEGMICLLMAAPLVMGMSVAGSLIGRGLAQDGKRSGRPVAMSVAVLPLAFALEAAFPPQMLIHTEQVEVIAAPPAAVWAALIDEGEISQPPPLVFRLGVAYPLRSEIDGAGVGAVRRGVFSTGVALEEITAWTPCKTLAFVVRQDPPAMRELSPYEHVHAPHVAGYFRTLETRFDLQPLAGGRTRLTERTNHSLRLDPALYWLPMARWMIDANNARVMAHVRALAERNATAG